jgi:hypothetical protein
MRSILAESLPALMNCYESVIECIPEQPADRSSYEHLPPPNSKVKSFYCLFDFFVKGLAFEVKYKIVYDY